MTPSPVTSLQYSTITLAQLRPTQMAVGLLQVKHKRKRLKALDKRPTELVEFILVHPVRVVLGPAKKVYVIDHHHLALALIREKFETAPMKVEADFSSLSLASFWKKMKANKFVYPYDGQGNKKDIAQIPKSLKAMEDDPYRSLAGFVREAGGFEKALTPFAEFSWAEYYRTRIKRKLIHSHFDKALKQAMKLAADPAAKGLPGYLSKK